MNMVLAGTRVSLDSVVIHFQQGASPERIADSFPTIPLANVYGAIAYYIENKDLIDAYVAEGEREFSRPELQLSHTNPVLFQRLEEIRQKAESKPA